MLPSWKISYRQLALVGTSACAWQQQSRCRISRPRCPAALPRARGISWFWNSVASPQSLARFIYDERYFIAPTTPSQEFAPRISVADRALEEPLHCECNHLQRLMEVFLVELDGLAEPTRTASLQKLVQVSCASKTLPLPSPTSGMQFAQSTAAAGLAQEVAARFLIKAKAAKQEVCCLNFFLSELVQLASHLYIAAQGQVRGLHLLLAGDQLRGHAGTCSP